MVRFLAHPVFNGPPTPSFAPTLNVSHVLRFVSVI